MKEIDIQVPKVQKVPNKLDPKRTTPRHIRIKIPKVQNKERILKVARDKKIVTYKGFSIDCQLISQKILCRIEGTGKTYSK